MIVLVVLLTFIGAFGFAAMRYNSKRDDFNHWQSAVAAYGEETARRHGYRFAEKQIGRAHV